MADHFTEVEASENLGVSVSKVRLVKNLIHGIRSEELALTVEALQRLSSDLGQESGGTAEELISAQVENEEIAAHVEKYLSPREQEVLRIRYGLEDGRARTLAETGRMLGVSRERVRQVEKRALQKLKIMLLRGKR
jgi:RNA polymerase primary sigma factor